MSFFEIVGLIIASALIGTIILMMFFSFASYLIIAGKKKKVKGNDKFIKRYLESFNADNKLKVIDETPRELQIGKRFYLLKPLKYRQYTRLCIMFAKTLEKLQGLNIDLTNADTAIGTIVENSEDEFFKALACVLFFSKNEYENDEKKIMRGIKAEFDYIKDNANLNQLSNALAVVSIQNDIDKALKSFGSLNPKKKNIPGT